MVCRHGLIRYDHVDQPTGANLNAMIGLTHAGACGADVTHLNAHKSEWSCSVYSANVLTCSQLCPSPMAAVRLSVYAPASVI